MDGRTCPMKALEVLDAGFLETRARLLEVAAFLDRLDRAGDPAVAKADFRYRALRNALSLLESAESGRAKILQMSFSDPTTEPRGSAKGVKGAMGAWDGGER